jgi:tripartite ATP-independent transporter DctM subunit
MNGGSGRLSTDLASGIESAGSWLRHAIEPVTRWLCYSGAALSLVMASVIVLSLLMRFLAGYILQGLIELETFMLVLMGFLSFAHTTLQDGHVSVDVFSVRFSPKLKSLLGCMFSIWGICLLSTMSWQAVVRALESFESGNRADITLIPYAPFYLIGACAYGLVALVIFANLLREVAKILRFHRSPGGSLVLVVIVSVVLMLLPTLLRFVSVELNRGATGGLFIGILLAVMLLGFPIAFSMAFIGFLGLSYLLGADVSLSVLRINLYDSFAHYYVCVIPFFGLMGFLCLESGIGSKLYKVGSKWFGQMPGGLAMGTIMGCGAFSSICGDSMATAATMGSVAIPEMKRYGYDDSLATGSVAAGGTLGILIPPSIGFIAYAIVTEQSIARLFMAGILPGILLTICMCFMVYLRCRTNPGLGPKVPPTSMVDKILSLKDVWPAVFLFLVVIGGIYSGIAPPTEAAALGTVGAFFIALISRRLTRQSFFKALLTTTHMTSMILMILVGVSILGNFFTLTDLPSNLAAYLKALPIPRYALYALILVFYVILGMLMNIIPMVMLTVPILFPTILGLGFDPIWFGVILVIIMEMGQVTPPVGMNVFVIYGISGGVPIERIFKGILPFLLVEVIVILVLTVFPEIALVLPNSMDLLAPIE